MFWLIRSVLSLAALVVVGATVVYFLPHETKLNVVEKIAGIVPESIKEETEELFLTPAESRDKVLTKLEENFEELKKAAPEKAKELVAESEAMIQKLKEKNDELSFTELARQKLVNLLLKGQTSTECK